MAITAKQLDKAYESLSRNFWDLKACPRDGSRVEASMIAMVRRSAANLADLLEQKMRKTVDATDIDLAHKMVRRANELVGTRP